MPEPRGWSLRTRLLVLLVCLAAALFGTSAVLNWRAHHGASDRLCRDSLRGSAHLLLQLAEHEMAEHGEVLGLALPQAETQPGPAGFHFQIWTPDMLAAAGAGAAPGPAGTPPANGCGRSTNASNRLVVPCNCGASITTSRS